MTAVITATHGYYDYYGGPNIVVGGGWGRWNGGWHGGHVHFHHR
jgi:hypothetical protein